MTLQISADGSGRSLATMAARLLVPVCVWFAYALWRGYDPLVVAGVALSLASLSLWSMSARGNWKQILIEESSIVLASNKERVVIPRERIAKLEMREQVVLVKWRAQTKDRIAILGRERFTPEAWRDLRAGLEP